MPRAKSETRATKPVAKKRTTTPSTEFILDRPDATAVCLAADFNQWNAGELKMKRDKQGVWKVKVKLAPGTYLYKFVVDGEWIEDPANPNRQEDPFGGCNSVIYAK